LLSILLLAGVARAGETDAVAASPTDVDGMLAEAREHERLASPGQACAVYEQIHARFPTDPRAATALAKAFELRLVLGELDQALAHGNLFVKRFGRSKPADAAGISYRMTEVFAKRGQTDQLVAGLRGYLGRWGKSDGPARPVIAHFKLGEILWQRSCPREEKNGACVELTHPYQERLPIRRAEAILPQSWIRGPRRLHRRFKVNCERPGDDVWGAIERDPRLAREAQEHFRAAVRRFDQPTAVWPADQELRRDAAFAAAGAAFYQAEQVYERLLHNSFPPDLDFQAPIQYDSPKVTVAKGKKLEDSTRRFLAYLTEQNRLAEQLAGADGLYELTIRYRVPHWQLAAFARMGQVYAHLADDLYTAEIPKSLKEQDEWGNRPREIFCDTLLQKAEPLEAKAVRGYERCLESAAQESWSNDWSTLCAEALYRISPDRYPRPGEILPEPELHPVPVPPLVIPPCAACDSTAR
jgi:hypothetical protein